MRLARLALALLVLSCAALHAPAPAEPDSRVFEFDEATTQRLVTQILAKRGIHVLPTPIEHVLATLPKVDGTARRALVPTEDGKLMVGEKTDYLHERTWAVSFQPLGPRATAVRVVRGDQTIWTGMPTYDKAARDEVAVDRRLPLEFKRDREEEAVIAAELDSQVSVEVSEGAEQPTREPVAPLADPAMSLAPPSPEMPSCGIEAHDIEALVSPGHFLLLGDPIGAQEPWAVLDQVRCLAQARALPVTFALSIPSAEQAAVNTYLSSTGSLTSRRTFLASPFWDREWQDGRSSAATLDFLERLRVERARGAAVSVLAVDSNLTGNPRNAHIAATLLKHRSEHPQRFIVALLGNTLTSRRVGTEWNAELLPVGARLAAVLPDFTHSFDVAFRTGTHWSCRLEAQGKLRCGTWAVAPGPDQTSRAVTPRPYFLRFDKPSSHGFDGVYFAGQLTASAPALEHRRVDEGARLLRR